MKNKRLVLVIIIGFVIIQARGYYYRNLKVDDSFLTTIAQSIIDLETIRVQNIDYTYDNYVDMHGVLNRDEMAKKSNTEIEIAFGVQGMSEYLYEYNKAMSKDMSIVAKDYIVKYQGELNQLEIILEPYREKNSAIDALWTNGVFK